MGQYWTQSAPAKVNLALHVTRRRDDGYHDLQSLVVFADLADELEAAPAASDSLAITGPFARGLSGGDTNLVSRAVAAFRARWPEAVPPGLAMRLRKNLPVAAGIGGGSADAAAALRLLADLSATPIPVTELAELGARLGADVPACLVSAPLVARGVGEILSPLPAFPECYLVLVNPLLPVSTPEVFRRLLKKDNPAMPALPEPMTRPAQLGIWLAETRNDLQAPAVELVPEIGRIIARLAAAPGCMLARMSGSGATVFGLFGSGAQAHQAAHEMRRATPDHWIAAAPVLGP
ncbi:4-(cytidine 5'-diphospho)-2-C-methyl-D-erythritol kinase [Devosia sp. 1566]|uniref:4-(cytidine 5'-diphospho)-2-C-methyl-D-erythritol kinase n=1 Tax=Devosia sp. 1566 TaxID=2499144 RepID=UPI000FD9C8E4|nr:4-(cytidine 5'-diphospho)-2-C-methyl-D-erythritol kinase [Devosia sp. 1566]